MINEERLVKLFRDLISINAPALQEANCVAFTKAHLQGLGLEVREDDAGAKIGGNANNLTSQRTADLGGGATFYDCRVQVERV